MRRLLLLLLLVGCGDPPAARDAGPTDAGAPDGTRCLDDARYEVCADGACATARCRGDELCADAACAPWEAAAPTCEFMLIADPTVDQQIRVQVAPGGFPRAQVEALRFDFGDGFGGWGETLRHRYEAPGVYPVTLDVRFVGMRRCRTRRLAVIDPPAGHDPLRLRVNEIPELLDGSEPFDRGAGPEAFHLAVPPAGWRVDVLRLDAPDDPVTAYTVRAGDLDVTARFVEEGGGVPWSTWIVDEPFAEGMLTLSVEATTASGASHRRELTVEVVPLPPERNPIEPAIEWLLRDDVDLFTTRREDAPGGYRLVSEPTPNGVPDLAEELAIIGGAGPDDALNARWLGWVRELVRREVYRTYGVAPDGTPTDGVPLTLRWTGEDGAPDPAAFAPDGAFSMIRFGGTFDGFVGYSEISPYYAERVDDSDLEHGVATASLIGILTSTPIVSTAIAPLAATPVGADPSDAAALDPGFDRFDLDADPAVLARHEELRAIARYLALVFASVCAHEMGHAMGLMPNGVPPRGFFGDEGDVPFVNGARTNRWHADLPGVNLMQAGGDYLGVVDEAIDTLELLTADPVRLAEILALENRLSPYARAYMQARLTTY